MSYIILLHKMALFCYGMWLKTNNKEISMHNTILLNKYIFIYKTSLIVCKI